MKRSDRLSVCKHCVSTCFAPAMQAKVHVNLHIKVPEISFAGFPANGMPSQDTTDKLASLMAKVKKKAGNERAPFPYFEVGDFVPDWSGVSP